MTITDKQMFTVKIIATSFKDICGGVEELSMVLGNLVAAQEWANIHPNRNENQIITDYSNY